MLRDFCKKLGLQIEAEEYNLNQEKLTILKPEFSQKYLLFKPENILKFYPVIKEYNIPCPFQRMVFNESKSLFKSQNYQPACIKFRETLYISNEIFGLFNYFSSYAYKRLSQISYFEGDYVYATLILQKAIAIEEKTNNDSSFLIQCYSDLATYHHIMGNNTLAFKLMHKSLEYISFIYPLNVYF
jgi:hypothetical protein